MEDVIKMLVQYGLSYDQACEPITREIEANMKLLEIIKTHPKFKNGNMDLEFTPEYEREMKSLKTLEEIVIESKWVHPATQKKCTVIGTYKVGQRERDYTFRITGWNPLPCKEFKGAYMVLADWLYENGWVRQISANKYEPGIVRYIHR